MCQYQCKYVKSLKTKQIAQEDLSLLHYYVTVFRRETSNYATCLGQRSDLNNKKHLICYLVVRQVATGGKILIMQ